MLLKEEVGGSALNSHGDTLLIMENHGKIMELCFSISVGTLKFRPLASWTFRGCFVYIQSLRRVG